MSEANDRGETDLLLLIQLENVEKMPLALLFEDKIDAPFQEGQAARYRQRGEQGIALGYWGSYRTCLVAPSGYISGVAQSDDWDGYISFEEISEWARSIGGPHEVFLARVCEQAIAKHIDNVSENSADAMVFWKAYREAASTVLPGLKITRLRSAVSRNHPYPMFGIDTLPSGVRLEHKPHRGCVDLQFDWFSVEALRKLTFGRLPSGVSVERTGSSAALRLAVPPLNHLKPFPEQEGDVLAAFAAIERLHALGQMVAPAILTQGREDGGPERPVKRKGRQSTA